MLHLAYCYECGYGISKDENKAFDIYLQIAKLDIKEAMVNVGRCYAEGIGINVDYHQMLKWYKNAGNKGNVRAQFILGEIYSQSSIYYNLEEARYWYKLAANQGHKMAQLNLGKIILEVENSTEYIKEAESYLFNSLIQGSIEALELYINLYGDTKLLELSVDILENLYALFRRKLPKGAIKKLYEFYLKKGENAISLLEKRKWIEQAKQLKLGPTDEELIEEYHTFIKCAKKYNEINDIFTSIYSWFGLTKSIYENIKSTATVLIQEVFAYNLMNIKPILSDEVFANQYISFYNLKDSDEYKEICFERDTDINDMIKFWFIKAFNTSDQNSRYNLLSDFYENIKNQIIFKNNYNLVFESDSKLKDSLNINENDIKKIFSDHYLLEAKKCDNSKEIYEYCKKSLLIMPDSPNQKVLQYLFELIEKEGDIKNIDSIYNFLSKNVDFSNKMIEANFCKRYAIEARKSCNINLINLYTKKAITLDPVVGAKELIDLPINFYINNLKAGNIVEEKDELDMLLANAFNLDYELARKSFVEKYSLNSHYLNNDALKLIFYTKLIDIGSSFNKGQMLDFFSMLIELEPSVRVISNLIDKMIMLTEPESDDREVIRILFCEKFILLGQKEKNLELKLKFYKTAQIFGGDRVTYHIMQILDDLNTMNITDFKKNYYREKIVECLNRKITLNERYK